MVTFVQGASGARTAARFALAQSMSPSDGLALQAHLFGDLMQADSPSTLTAGASHNPSGAGGTFFAIERMESTIGLHWFNKVHVVPRSFDFGNLLSDQSEAIEVFNAYLYEDKVWASLVNGAGDGVSLGGQPILSEVIGNLNGVEMTLDVSASGPAFVDATLDFAFTGLPTIYVPIEIQRIVLWGAEPEAGFSEEFESLVRVHESKDGTEKRISYRNSPRHSWVYDFKIDEGIEAQTLENLLFDFQSLTFGVPERLHETELTAATVPGDTSIAVGSTDYRDFRAGGLVVIYTDQRTFDALPIAAGGIASSSITLDSPVVGTYAAGTKVFPLPVCRFPSKVSGARWAGNLQSIKVRFEDTNNDVDLADLSAFESFNGKLLLSNGNSMRQETVGHQFEVKVDRIDGSVGQVYQDSSWGRNKRSHQFSLRAEGRQAIFELRQLVYGIDGKFKSFYVPRDSDDLLVVSDLTSGGNTMNVQNVGYTQFVRNRQPRNVIRVNFVDGSTPLIRTIIASTSPSATVDQLTMDSNWPSTFTPEEISRVEYVEEVRFDTNTLRIDYAPTALLAFLTAPIKVLFE